MEEDNDLIEMVFYAYGDNAGRRWSATPPLVGDWVKFGDEKFQVTSRTWDFTNLKTKIIYEVRPDWDNQ